MTFPLTILVPLMEISREFLLLANLGSGRYSLAVYTLTMLGPLGFMTLNGVGLAVVDNLTRFVLLKDLFRILIGRGSSRNDGTTSIGFEANNDGRGCFRGTACSCRVDADTSFIFAVIQRSVLHDYGRSQEG
mmetsp:Transcript_27521/g.49596  ORF Transcript_27521/g.49596 Transcript_27521/m.49596 type:complete len:132 (-) Transcript_27521:527-922(-)